MLVGAGVGVSSRIARAMDSGTGVAVGVGVLVGSGVGTSSGAPGAVGSDSGVGEDVAVCVGWGIPSKIALTIAFRSIVGEGATAETASSGTNAMSERIALTAASTVASISASCEDIV